MGKVLEDNTYVEKYTVRSWDIDADYRLRFHAFAQHFQETAALHASDFSLAAHDIIKSNMLWVISRMSWRITRFPKWRDPFNMETWYKGSTGISTFRDFLMTDENGNEFARASSLWCLVDTEEKRPVKSDWVEQQLPANRERASMGKGAPFKVPAFDSASAVKELVAGYDDVDINGHVNNVSYVKWIMSSVPDTRRRDYIPYGMDINFKSEAVEGDSIVVKTGEPAEDNSIIHIIEKKDGTEVCRALSFWREAQ